MERNQDSNWFTVTRNARGKRTTIPEDGNGPTVQRKSYLEVAKGRNMSEPNLDSRPISIFVHNLPASAMAKDVWNFFGYKRHIKDIFLPKKRDVNGTRYGFIHTNDLTFASHLVIEFSGIYFMENKLTLKINTYHPRSKLPQNANLVRAGNHDNVHHAKFSDNKKNYESTEKLVKQPTHRTVKLFETDETSEELLVSIIGITKEDQWADVLQENITLNTFIPTRVVGISHRKFLITFPTLENKEELPLEALQSWFTEFLEASHGELIPPRLAWLHCEGLPLTMWNLENWEKILGDWGQILTRNFKIFKCGMIQGPMICIQTYQVRDIEETIKVLIKDKGYWIKIRESKLCFKEEEISTLTKPTSVQDNNNMETDNQHANTEDDSDWISEETLYT